MGTLYCDHSFPIYTNWICELFTKIFIIMPMSTNIHGACVCDTLIPYTLLVNKYIDLISLIG